MAELIIGNNLHWDRALLKQVQRYKQDGIVLSPKEKRTIKGMIMQYMAANNLCRYLDVLPKIV